MDETRWRTEESPVRRCGRHVALAAAVAAWLAAGSACKDNPGPGPDPERDLMCPEAQVQVCDPAVRTVARDASSDAVSRSVPALENAAGRAALAGSLGQLDGAIANGNITQARLAFDNSRSALAAAGGEAADAPDLGAIELLLDYVGPLIGR
jgi:hypothetical protein